jgi:ectoine hydroxylase-related dioxygenase (phytanoyl-CoA dioxygenase family)
VRLSAATLSTSRPSCSSAAERELIIADGFVTLDRADLPWAASLRAMRVAVRRLIRRGWPATMLLVYDEAWSLAHQLSAVMRAVSGGCVNSFDTLAWSITPALGESGFAPHRDRQPANVAASFRADGTAKYVTAWIALSTASTDNSCLYLVPRQYDHGYDAGDDHRPEAEDPLLTVMRSDAAVQAVRACPLKPGSAVLFTHRAMHWGSLGQSRCEAPRISISFGHTDPSFEAPYLAKEARRAPFPAPKARVALCAAQLINYHERFRFDVRLLRRLGETFKAHCALFTKAYAEKTAAEFISAYQDRVSAATPPPGAPGPPGAAADAGEGSEDSEAEAELDDALDAMLDAQADADANLFDDFDDYSE